MTVFPTKMGMTLRRFSYELHFICACCDASVTSKFRAETPDGVICNRCYGRKLLGVSPVKETEAPAPLAVGGTVTGRISCKDAQPGVLPVFALRKCNRLHLTPSECGKEYGCESDS